MYIYSNAIGTFVFSDHFQVRETHLFTREEAQESIKLLMEGKEIPSEKVYLSKFKSIENIREAKDTKKLQRVLEELRQYRDAFYENSMFIVKNSIRESVSSDLLIIQSISSIEELNRTINLLVKRLREWYSYYYPELSEKVSDNEAFTSLVLTKKKKELMKESMTELSMGKDLPAEDVSSIIALAEEVRRLYVLRQRETEYLEAAMEATCPNMKAITGALIGAKLIALAGSVKRMVLFPASTIQLLGAEKALFRHIRNKKALPPKYGVIFQHPMIQKTRKPERGKVARLLADKISLAVKIDYFKGEYRGETLLKELEEKVSLIEK